MSIASDASWRCACSAVTSSAATNTKSFPRSSLGVFAGTDTSTDVDLVDLGYRFMVTLATNFAGIDMRDGSADEFDELVRMLRMFGVAATLGQATNQRDREQARAEVQRHARCFRYASTSSRRRPADVNSSRKWPLATRDAQSLPMDVLTVLLASDAPLDGDMMLRETAFYFLASAHTSVHSLTHSVHHLLDMCDADDQRCGIAWVADRGLVQRCVHESFRLHPSSPVARRRALESDSRCRTGRRSRRGRYGDHQPACRESRPGRIRCTDAAELRSVPRRCHRGSVKRGSHSVRACTLASARTLRRARYRHPAGTRCR